MTIYLAYDGTIHGDWVAHYAVRMAAADPSQALVLLYVEEGHIAEDILRQRIQRIGSECARLGVSLASMPLPLERDVRTTLERAISADNACVILGARDHGRNRGLLTGSVGEHLLKSPRYRALVLRVVQPGLLGAPHRILLPVAGHPEGIAAALPTLRLLMPPVDRLHILNVNCVSAWRFRRLNHPAMVKLRLAGHEYCQWVERELGEQLSLKAAAIDTHAIVSDDVPKEIVIQANRLKSQLIFMGASQRNPAQRYFYGTPLEQVLRNAPCDVAIYGGAR